MNPEKIHILASILLIQTRELFEPGKFYHSLNLRPKGVINFHNIQQVSLDSTQLFWSMILNRFFYGEVDGIIGILNVIQQIFSGLHG